MVILALRGAPQLTRLIREVPPFTCRQFLTSLSAPADPLDHSAGADGESPQQLSAELEALHEDEIIRVEREARRITRLDTSQADALHLRLAETIGFDCRLELEDIAGPISRAASSYSQRPLLFRQVERAMQMRSFREHRTIYEAYELFEPVELDLADMADNELAIALAERLGLRDGCTIEAVELPADTQSAREIMIAVTTGGALASQRTFVKHREVQVIQYRPATELIMVYRPDLGRIEVCGRQWQDRKSVAQYLASHVLGQDLSTRPLTQRNYDLSPFRNGLKIDVPAALEDRIQSVAVTEARFALGTYDRKVTVHALAGEDINAIVRDVLKGLGTRHGQPFLCDVELLLSISLPDRGGQSLRFRITNQNRSTLQAETDPEKRAIGFALLGALGLVTTLDSAREEIDGDLIAGLLDLLAHERDTIGAAEVREMRASVSRLTRGRFLTSRQIGTTLLIDDEDIGPVEGTVETDLVNKRASIGLSDAATLENRDLDEVLSWTINRDYVREVVLGRLAALRLSRHPEDRGNGIYWLGEGLIDEVRRPVFLMERGTDLDAIEKADRLLRASATATGGLILTPTKLPLGSLNRFAIMFIGDLLDPETGKADEKRVADLWSARRKLAETASELEFHDHGQTAELILPGLDPLPIVGQQRILIFARLVEAATRGDGPRKTGDLLANTGYSNFQSAFRENWKNHIFGRYVIRAGRGLYRLGDGKTDASID